MFEGAFALSSISLTKPAQNGTSGMWITTCLKEIASRKIENKNPTCSSFYMKSG